MKILHVIPAFHPAYPYGGTVTVSYQLTKNLASRGHEITVYTGDGFDSNSRQANSFLNINNIDIYYFKNINNSLSWNRFAFAPEMFLKLRTHIKDYDVIHLHGFRNFGNLFALYYAKKYGVPIIIEPHGSILKNNKRENLKTLYDVVSNNLLNNNCYKVIVATDLEASEAEKANIPTDKIIQILPGYDTQYFLNLPEAGRLREKLNLKNKKIILFLGRINLIKGIDFLVNAFNQLTKQRNDTVLLIVGPDDGEKSSLERRLSKQNLSSKVMFPGFLSGIDKLSAYVDADIFVQTSKYERFCGSPFEAILCNTPVIVTRDTGCGQFVQKMDIGYTVDYGNETQLKDTLNFILDNPNEPQIKTEKGKQYLINNLSWESVVKRYERLYQDAANEKMDCYRDPAVSHP